MWLAHSETDSSLGGDSDHELGGDFDQEFRERE